jgi:hypothetical protein
VTATDERCWDQLRQLFDGRRDWKLEPQSTPGVLPVWCLRIEGDRVLSVGVVDGAFSVYLIDRDQEIMLDAIVELATWLDGNESLFRQRSTMSRELFDSLVDQRIQAQRRLER